MGFNYIIKVWSVKQRQAHMSWTHRVPGGVVAAKEEAEKQHRQVRKRSARGDANHE